MPIAAIQAGNLGNFSFMPEEHWQISEDVDAIIDCPSPIFVENLDELVQELQRRKPAPQGFSFVLESGRYMPEAWVLANPLVIDAEDAAITHAVEKYGQVLTREAVSGGGRSLEPLHDGLLYEPLNNMGLGRITSNPQRSRRIRSSRRGAKGRSVRAGNLSASMVYYFLSTLASSIRENDHVAWDWSAAFPRTKIDQISMLLRTIELELLVNKRTKVYRGSHQWRQRVLSTCPYLKGMLSNRNEGVRLLGKWLRSEIRAVKKRQREVVKGQQRVC